ncbi:MAG TPA: RNA pseudouridine synthase [Xanthobacteraceae bacterium]|nr:RNA pseudouridine synthase [Xanthobacteraceae bacterium]
MLDRVLYRDGLMLVIDKPAGLSVHRGPKGGPSLEDYLDALRYGLPRRPELAHRLDKDTSGCLVLGRHRKALAHLGLLFKHRRIGKTYWAVVEGGPEAEEGTIDLPLGRLDDRIGWWMKPDPHGLPSVTKWTVMGRTAVALPSPARGGGRGDGSHEHRASGFPLSVSPPQAGERTQEPQAGEGKLTWLALEPLTGRTHQLRVHCAAQGWPIVGDDIYGSAPRFSGPVLHLHAREIVVPISKNREPVQVVAPVPAHMRERLTACGWNGDAELQ